MPMECIPAAMEKSERPHDNPSPRAKLHMDPYDTKTAAGTPAGGRTFTARAMLKTCEVQRRPTKTRTARQTAQTALYNIKPAAGTIAGGGTFTAGDKKRAAPMVPLE